MKHFKSNCIIILNRILRLLERCLPVPLLLMLCIPLAWFLALGVLIISRKPQILENSRIYLNKFLLAFSARLGAEKWSKRCETHFSDTFIEDQESGRPMMLLFLHHGHFKQLPYWLRSRGVRASAIIKSKASRRKKHRLWRDQRDLFPEQKVMWGRDELKSFIKQLENGGSLLMAVDSDLGKQEIITLKGGKDMTIASGPFRIAEKHNCEIYPCGLVGRGRWKFRLTVGDRYDGDKSKLMSDLFACYEL